MPLLWVIFQYSKLIVDYFTDIILDLIIIFGYRLSNYLSNHRNRRVSRCFDREKFVIVDDVAVKSFQFNDLIGVVGGSSDEFP
ncbi:hypothetical protein SAMN05216327_1332 [Dyadobacter sp. SG02]|nr:hypothetical protein SAMN05216327_1332 [Dyadobacter sp. SG02]